jgi:thiamine-phosphate pyrophosphorylase
LTSLKGLYLVVDPGLGSKGLEATRLALLGGVDIVQMLAGTDAQREFARELRDITRTHHIPLLINNNVDLARQVEADGVHIDGKHPSPSEVKKVLGDNAIVGYTCGNDLEKVRWATRTGADYVSFCSIFPSGTAGECEIVPLETVARARGMTRVPMFAAGGISHENASRVLSTGIDGIAVVSAILSAPDPRESARRFKQILEKRDSNVIGENQFQRILAAEKRSQ